MVSCIFCKIAHHREPAHIILENNIIIAFLDIDPISDGHMIIIPKEDIKDIHELSPITCKHLLYTAKILADVLKETFDFDGINIQATSGYFQDVPHFHLHVFGRHKNNDIEVKYPENISIDERDLVDNKNKILKNLDKL